MESEMTQRTAQDQVHVQTLPDRNFVAGWPKNPATYVATHDDGRYYEAFVSEYACKADFAHEALLFFNPELRG
jgi:hypothetical protein